MMRMSPVFRPKWPLYNTKIAPMKMERLPVSCIGDIFSLSQNLQRIRAKRISVCKKIAVLMPDVSLVPVKMAK